MLGSVEVTVEVAEAARGFWLNIKRLSRSQMLICLSTMYGQGVEISVRGVAVK